MPKEKAKSDRLGQAEYRAGALERIEDAQVLLERGQFAGSIYMAGRGVEGMLRALIWRADPDIRSRRKPLESGHDLRALLLVVRNRGLLRAGAPDELLTGQIQDVAQLWFNNMRFVSERYVERAWRSAGRVSKRVTLKRAAEQFVQDCIAIVNRCEVLCQR